MSRKPFNPGFDRRRNGGYPQDHYRSSSSSQNCSFYLKIGACRHGNRCSRVHNPVQHSLTVILPHFYENPLTAQKSLEEVESNPNIGRNSYYQPFKTLKEKYLLEDFYVDVFEELSKYGEIDTLLIASNVCDHLVGNVYVKYYMEEDAEKAVRRVNGRFYKGRMVKAALTPVADFDEAKCRTFYELKGHGCKRHGDCNFLHEIPINPKLIEQLIKGQEFYGLRSNRQIGKVNQETEEVKKEDDQGDKVVTKETGT